MWLDGRIVTGRQQLERHNMEIRKFLRIFLGILLISSWNLRLVAGTFVGGQVVNQYWASTNSPYLVTNDISASNLVIEAGVTVQFLGNFQFSVVGDLQAVGSTANLIVFMGTNTESWKGLTFSSASTNCLLDYCW